MGILQSEIGISIAYLSLLGWCVFLFAAMVCTRKSMREHYKLPGACCIDGDCVDDCCVTYWCSCFRQSKWPATLTIPGFIHTIVVRPRVWAATLRRVWLSSNRDWNWEKSENGLRYKGA